MKNPHIFKKPVVWPKRWEYKSVRYRYETNDGGHVVLYYISFPHWWNGWMTGMYCVFKKIGLHLVFCDENDNFTTIGVVNERVHPFRAIRVPIEEL